MKGVVLVATMAVGASVVGLGALGAVAHADPCIIVNGPTINPGSFGSDASVKYTLAANHCAVRYKMRTVIRCDYFTGVGPDITTHHGPWVTAAGAQSKATCDYTDSLVDWSYEVQNA